MTFWPAADEKIFSPREPDVALRTALGIQSTDTVLMYHGNVHAANAAEVGSLYQAVARLNQQGCRTFLIRAGRDDANLMDEHNAAIGTNLLHLGYIAPRFLPEIMRLADDFVQPGSPGAFNDYRFPSKLPEFFAIGRPVILPHTNLGASVKHGEDAYVLPEANADTIAAAVLELHRDQELRSRLARGAVNFAARHFSWRRSADRLLDFYLSHSSLAPVHSTVTLAQ
jgi:glycosyltransferase involved in cell wall biosynthesis